MTDFSHTDKIKTILNSEKDRLDNKKKTIDDAIVSQKRIMFYNDNNRKIYASYIRILIVFTVILAIIWCVNTLKQIITFVPESVFDITLVLTICIGIIVIYNYYIDILMRKRNNFDEINSAPPTILKSDPDVSNASNGDIMGGLMNICVGEQCCNPRPEGQSSASTDVYTIWDNTTSKCKKQEMFTTIAKEEYEYANYSPYK